MNRFFLLMLPFLVLNTIFGQTAFDLGLEAYDNGQYQEAIDLYSKHIRSHNNGNTHFNRALAYYKLGMNAEAIEDYTIVINQDPTDFEAWHNRGLAYYDQGDLKKSFFDSKKTISLNPEYEKAYNTIGLCYSSWKKYQEAIESYTQGIELTKNDLYYYNRALAYQELKQFDKAEMDFTSAINLNESIDYYWGRANLLYNNKDYAMSLEDYGTAIEMDSSISSLFYNRGLSYYADYKDELALNDFQKALSLDAEDIDAKWYITLCQYELENYEESLNFYNQVVLQNPNYEYLNQLNKDELVKKTKLGNNLLYIVSLIALALLAIILFSKLFLKKEIPVRK
ncbi:MAG: tetratricopeptide (TPR) repeat protein [Planctomycetota bacterium]|jgi:tetratricopeptide (TPR) repeat protein